jgi:glycosyltransferase involved in cell wall biosynthesis
VLVASKFWYTRGGLERVMFTEIEQLESRGIETAHFSTRHPDNTPSPWESYFAPYLELGAGGGLGAADSARAALRMFRNGVAARCFERLLADFKPDVVHIHGIHRQLSPSILLVARRRGVPVVQTLHDAHHVCPADVLLRGGCVACEPRSCGVYDYTPAIRYRCVRGSLAATGLSAAETAFQRLTHAYERTVTRFVTPSAYLGGVMSEGGWTSVPIDVVPNGVPVPAQVSRADEGFFLVAGRLSAEKRVDIALEAARGVGARVVVAGEGPESAALRERYPEAEFVGHVDASRVADLLGRCRAAVMTSIWPENAPMSVLEAMAAGCPVIASRIGGIPEIVEDGVTGILAPAGDVAAVADAMRALASDPARAAAMGEAGHARALSEYTLERHTDRLLEVYHRAISTAKGLE